MTVTLEDYTINEQYSEGRDFVVDITLKQYEVYGAKKLTVVTDNDTTSTAEATLEGVREDANAPNVKTHIYKAGDSITGLAKMYLGDGQRWGEIEALNTPPWESPLYLKYGDVIKIPPR
jgi:nucleoid-associated protein YgaU